MNTRALITAALLWASIRGMALAQAHYPAGAEGIKAATLPPPGLYLRMYNFFYTAARYDAGPAWFSDIFAYIAAPRLVWMSEHKVLGANYGMDVIVPFGFVDIDNPPAAAGKARGWSVGDIQLEPVLFGWHFPRFDVGAGYAIWLPTGADSDPADLGKGYWTHMLTLGATWYLDAEKKWALSVLNRYEFNHEHEDTGITPGQVWTVEWGLSRNIGTGMDLGLVGYFQWQTTKDDGTGASDVRDQVLGLGPEITVPLPYLGALGSIRYNFEMLAHARPEGHTLTVTLTKRF